MLRKETHVQVRAWVLQSHFSPPSCSSLLCALFLSFLPISSLIPVLRSGAQVTRPVLLRLPPLLGRSCGFNLHSVCATCAVPGRVFPSEQLVAESRVPLNATSGICLLLFTRLCQNTLNDREMGMLSSHGYSRSKPRAG